MKGTIVEKEDIQYNTLKIFLPITKKDILRYNWLLSDIDSDYYSEGLTENGYEFLTGSDFLKLITGYEYHFVWGVFSAFSKEIPLEKILSEGIPYANEYSGFWKNSISIQNKLAVTELVIWDGVLALVISKEDEVVNRFLNYYKLSEDLEIYNKE